MTIAAGTRLGVYEVLGALGAGALGEVYRATRVSIDHVCGALCGYLLIGLIFGHLYCVVEQLSPGSFRSGGDALTAVDEGRRHFVLTYFSLVTLTTLGYGDVLPVREWARGLARAGVLKAEEARGIEAALTTILERGRAEPSFVDGPDEDVHSFVERQLIERRLIALEKHLATAALAPQAPVGGSGENFVTFRIEDRDRTPAFRIHEELHANITIRRIEFDDERCILEWNARMLVLRVAGEDGGGCDKRSRCGCTPDR